MTLKKLAELSGVSVATVSKAFSHSREINRETREHIFEIARREGCFEKYDKGAHDRVVIAVLCPEICSEFYTRILTSLEEGFGQRGIDTVFSVTHFDPVETARLYNYYAGRQSVSGVIVIGDTTQIKDIGCVPTVQIDGATNIEDACLRFDMTSAFYDAVQLLKELGHERIAFIGEAKTLLKRDLFFDAMRKAGLPVSGDYVIVGEERFEKAGRIAMQKLLLCDPIPTAVIAAYDYIAFGAMQFARERGIRIPEQMSVIGIDDLSLNNYVDVPLSSIRVDTDKLCETVIRMMLGKLRHCFYKLKDSTTFDAELVRRETVASAPSEEKTKGDDNVI